MTREQCSASTDSRPRTRVVTGLRAVVPVVCALFLSIVATPAQQQSFILGVFVGIDNGGQLLPVARFNGREWTSTWPQPRFQPLRIKRVDEIPRSWLGGPPPRTWTTWKSGGRTSKVRITGVSWMGGTADASGCGAAVVLNTPARGEIPEAGTLAFDVPQRVSDVVEIPASSDEGRSIVSRLGELFTAAEEETIRRGKDHETSLGGDGPRYPLTLPAESRAAAGIAVLKLFRARQMTAGAATTYLIEALKAFPRGSSSAGGDRLMFSGWIASAGDRLKPLKTSAGVDFSDDMHSTRARPLAILQVAGRSVWVVDLSQYESALLELVDVTPSGIRHIAYADVGGC
jgi:hypothetical protein